MIKFFDLYDNIYTLSGFCSNESRNSYKDSLLTLTSISRTTETNTDQRQPHQPLFAEYAIRKADYNTLEGLLRSSKRWKIEKTDYLYKKCIKKSTESLQTQQGLEVDNENIMNSRTLEIKGHSIPDDIFLTQNSLGQKELEVDRKEGINQESPKPEIVTTEKIEEHISNLKCVKTSILPFQTQQQIEFEYEEGIRQGNPEITITKSFQTQERLEVYHEEKLKPESPNIKVLSTSECFTSEQIEEHTSSPKCVKTSTESFQTQLGLEVDNETGTKPKNSKIKGLSMCEILTKEQIKEHISSFNQVSNLLSPIVLIN